jgi:hypothetical protein
VLNTYIQQLELWRKYTDILVNTSIHIVTEVTNQGDEITTAKSDDEQDLLTVVSNLNSIVSERVTDNISQNESTYNTLHSFSR